MRSLSKITQPRKNLICFQNIFLITILASPECHKPKQNMHTFHSTVQNPEKTIKKHHVPAFFSIPSFTLHTPSRPRSGPIGSLFVFHVYTTSCCLFLYIKKTFKKKLLLCVYIYNHTSIFLIFYFAPHAVPVNNFIICLFCPQTHIHSRRYKTPTSTGNHRRLNLQKNVPENIPIDIRSSLPKYRWHTRCASSLNLDVSQTHLPCIPFSPTTSPL